VGRIFFQSYKESKLNSGKNLSILKDIVHEDNLYGPEITTHGKFSMEKKATNEWNFITLRALLSVF